MTSPTAELGKPWPTAGVASTDQDSTRKKAPRCVTVRLSVQYVFCNARYVDRASANPVIYPFAYAPERGDRGPPWGFPLGSEPSSERPQSRARELSVRELFDSGG